ncbi:MAG: hypothetical protein WCF33_05215 [Pseudonocardiaceae bacterium]
MTGRAATGGTQRGLEHLDAVEQIVEAAARSHPALASRGTRMRAVASSLVSMELTLAV